MSVELRSVTMLAQGSTVAMDGAEPPTKKPKAASKRYAAFLSHYKVEAAMEARYLKLELESTLGRDIFLDSDDLHDLTRLKEAVTESDVLVLLQSARVLERPWCLIEIATALDHAIPIVGVSLTTGGFAVILYLWPMRLMSDVLAEKTVYLGDRLA